ncbi:MAG: ribose 5-phosphate isomerase B [Acidobacteriota bacterium]|nr:ribose 5-phosphate isomerase B [Acidobacteriota bacterium]
MASPKQLSEEQVRAVVRRVVEEWLESAGPGSRDAGAKKVGSQSTPSGPVATSGSTSSPTGAGRAASGGSDAVALGADHGGFELKEALIAHLRGRGVAVVDCGTYSEDSCDYPDFAHEVARRVADGSCRWGVIVDGAGIGSAMVANKVPGVRAAACYDLAGARNSREHNHANVLSLGSGWTGPALAKEILDAWLATPWGEGRHARRAAKIDEYEARYTR